MKGQIFMAKSLETLRKDGLANKLAEQIIGGERKTINEYAERFDVMPNAIQSALGQLRKLGFHAHPVGTVTGPKGETQRGKVIDIMADKTGQSFQEVYQRRMNNGILPAILDLKSKSEIGIKLFPSLKHWITVGFNGVYSMIREAHDAMRLPEPKALKEMEEVKEVKKEVPPVAPSSSSRFAGMFKR